jgi:hypothetical protein
LEFGKGSSFLDTLKWGTLITKVHANDIYQTRFNQSFSVHRLGGLDNSSRPTPGCLEPEACRMPSLHNYVEQCGAQSVTDHIVEEANHYVIHLLPKLDPLYTDGVLATMGRGAYGNM